MLQQIGGTERIKERERKHFGSGATLMASELIDRTLPAHAPHLPESRGLVPVPPELAETVGMHPC